MTTGRRPHRHARVALAVAFSLGCAAAATPPDSTEDHFTDTAAIRVSPGRAGEWLLLFEKLQPEFLITMPIRSAGLLGAGSNIVAKYDAPDGWTLIDAAAHPSGDVSLLTVRVDPTAPYPMKAMVSRFGAGGTHTDFELVRLPPPSGPEPAPAFISSLDRARIVARGEELFAVVRWANNAVQAYRLALAGQGLEEKWAAWVEPPAPLFPVGIIGGGFDNFHQGDTVSLIHADLDGEANLYVAVAGTQEVLTNHDGFFGEDLLSKADPASFDFGVAVLTRITAEGVRSFATLLGSPGRNKQLINLRTARDAVILVGRMKTGDQPGSWDAWMLSSQAATGQVNFERTIDIQNGDMFWDVAALTGGRLLAVGSTNYTQNPSGLSVSDARDALAVVLDAAGKVEKRIALPAGPPGRGNEAMAVSAGDQVAICGVENAPGTHAPVFSDAFLVVRGPDPF